MAKTWSVRSGKSDLGVCLLVRQVHPAARRVLRRRGGPGGRRRVGGGRRHRRRIPQEDLLLPLHGPRDQVRPDGTF